MRPLQLNQVDFAKLRSGKNYQHLNCHIMEFLYDDEDKLTFIAKRLKVHQFGMRRNVYNPGSQDTTQDDWRIKKQLTLTFDQSEASEESTFLSSLENRLIHLIKENSDMVKAFTGPSTIRSRHRQADPNLLLMATSRLVKTPDRSDGQGSSRLHVPFFKVNLPMLVNRSTGEPEDRFKFTIRDGITGSILENFKPSAGNEQMVGNDRLSAVLQLDRVVAYSGGISIQLALFQGKLYPRDRLHELPPQHMFHGPEPGRFPVIDLLASDDVVDVVDDGDGNGGDGTHDNDQRGIPPLESSPTCPVCLTASLTTVLNCGHAFCRTCAETITACGVCRAAIVERRPLYLV